MLEHYLNPGRAGGEVGSNSTPPPVRLGKGAAAVTAAVLGEIVK